MNIEAVARRTGVRAATLRKWEQRYQVLRPERTAGSHRRYSERDVLRVEWLKARLAEGYRIGEAAALLGVPDELPGNDPAALRAALADAATDGARRGFGALLDECFALYAAEAAVDQVVAPTLRAIGERWEAGELSIAEEHRASALVRRKLHALIEPHPAGRGAKALLACAPGERHEIGLLCAGLVLQRNGWDIVYLGPDTPTAQALELAAELGCGLVALSATMPEHAALADTELAEIEGDFPGITVLRGGAAYGGDAASVAVAGLHAAAAA
ncbi:MAG: MerR family transcriptional regulator [Actinobacteria bacterium]|nr:MerR family transcriptional regulator [Actinomycetota bacterium]